MTATGSRCVVVADRIVDAPGLSADARRGPDGVVAASEDVGAPQWLVTDDGVVTMRGSGALPPSVAALPTTTVHGTLVPGFVDIHAHGALGVDFASASVADARRAAGHHHRSGTTSLVASIATGALEDTRAALRRLAPLVADGTLAGLHLEGPYLAPTRRGAHASALLRTPDITEIDDLLDAAQGTIRMVTIAPELPGALPAVEHMVRAGVVVAIGHTDADTATARAAVDAGARVVTHLFNGMPPLHHRAPGPVGVALTDDRLLLELIIDGHHLDPTAIAVVEAAAAGRIAFVSDAMAATGCADGHYRIAGSDVVVDGGVAMLADRSSLAGSTITVSDAVVRTQAGRTTGAQAGSEGHATPEALATLVERSSAAAARTLGLTSGLTVGAPADAVVLDHTLRPTGAVLRRGTWLPSS